MFWPFFTTVWKNLPTCELPSAVQSLSPLESFGWMHTVSHMQSSIGLNHCSVWQTKPNQSVRFGLESIVPIPGPNHLGHKFLGSFVSGRRKASSARILGATNTQWPCDFILAAGQLPQRNATGPCLLQRISATSWLTS